MSEEYPDVRGAGPPRSRDTARLSWSELSAQPRFITDTRVHFGRWLEQLELDSTKTYDIILAVYEAMANVVEHAYRSQGATATPNVFDLNATLEDSRLEVAVVDHGTWSDAVPGPLRGRGLPLIETLSDDVTVASAESGTTVTMAWDIDSRSIVS
ncbi:MAG: ATP-binding protein [Rhodococcus sp. (in: high G+C Gram-positive bacteria)]